MMTMNRAEQKNKDIKSIVIILFIFFLIDVIFLAAVQLWFLSLANHVEIFIAAILINIFYLFVFVTSKRIGTSVS